MSERNERTYRVVRLGAESGRERPHHQEFEETIEIKENRVAPMFWDEDSIIIVSPTNIVGGPSTGRTDE